MKRPIGYAVAAPDIGGALIVVTVREGEKADQVCRLYRASLLEEFWNVYLAWAAVVDLGG